jgi:hypothetical protein
MCGATAVSSKKLLKEGDNEMGQKRPIKLENPPIRLAEESNAGTNAVWVGIEVR